MEIVKKICCYILKKDLECFKKQHQVEIDILKWEKQLIIHKIRDWRRWMQMTCAESKIYEKADKQIQDICNKLNNYK